MENKPRNVLDTLNEQGEKIEDKNIDNQPLLEVETFIKQVKESWGNTESEALKMFKSALPKDLFINIESIAKKELGAIKEDLWNTINEKWLGQITQNTELMQAIATALIDNKTIPDSDKELIANLLNKDYVPTTESLKVELLPVENVVEEEIQEKVLID
jgi:hypothetical protein